MNEKPTLKDSFCELKMMADNSPELTDAILNNLPGACPKPLPLGAQVKKLVARMVVLALVLGGLYGLAHLALAVSNPLLNSVAGVAIPEPWTQALGGHSIEKLKTGTTPPSETLSMMHLLFLYLEATFHFAWTMLGIGFLFGLAGLQLPEAPLSHPLEVCS